MWTSIDFLPRRALGLGLFGSGVSAARCWAHGLAWGCWALWCGWLALEWLRTSEEIGLLLSQQRKPAVPAVSTDPRPSEALSDAQVKLAAEVISRLNLDWPLLLNELERLTPAEIAILEIEPRPAQRTVSLTVEARSAEPVLHYVDVLGQSRSWRGVRVVRHDTDGRDGARSLRFVLLLDMGGRW